MDQVRTLIWSCVIDIFLAETEPFFLFLGTTDWLSEQLLRVSKGPRPCSARCSCDGIAVAGHYSLAELGLMRRRSRTSAAGHDHPSPVPAPAALSATSARPPGV
jgi:hypothetical protein